MNDVIVRLVPLPPGIHGFVMEDPAGDYNVYIREEDPEAVQQETFGHELRHCFLGHLKDDAKSIEEKEREADYGFSKGRSKEYRKQCL